MYSQTNDEALAALRDIRSMMDRSARFLSLSGWSGIWAGCMALLGACVAYNWLLREDVSILLNATYRVDSGDTFWLTRFALLGGSVFSAALIGGYYFTQRKARQDRQKVWNATSRQLLFNMAVPLTAGAVLVAAFMYYGTGWLVAPACLIFYGLALISSSKYTLPEIQALGLLELLLGCICLFMPGYGLYFWAAGFGILHILYGIIMWYKYERRAQA